MATCRFLAVILALIILLGFEPAECTTGFSTSSEPVVYTWRIRGPNGEVLREFKTEYTAANSESWLWQRDYFYAGEQAIGSEGNSSLLGPDFGKLRFHLDHLGTPRVVTDETGNVYSTHIYQPYGDEITLWNDRLPIKFTGHERDFDNTDYMHARYYKNDLGRFVSPDPVDSGWNAYSYSSNNPVNDVDPTGLCPEDICGPPVEVRLGRCYDSNCSVITSGHGQRRNTASIMSREAYYRSMGLTTDQQIRKFADPDLIGLFLPGGGFRRALSVGKGFRVTEGVADTFYSYRELRILLQDYGLRARNVVNPRSGGFGLEAHHLLEKTFAARFGLAADEILSVPVTPIWHRNLGRQLTALENSQNIHAEILQALDKMGTTPANAAPWQIWQAHKSVYLRSGNEEWAQAIYEQYFGPMGIRY